MILFALSDEVLIVVINGVLAIMGIVISRWLSWMEWKRVDGKVDTIHKQTNSLVKKLVEDAHAEGVREEKERGKK